MSEPPGKWASAFLALAMHAVLAAFLFFGVRWQTKPPEIVSVDLVRAVPPTPTFEPPPPEAVKPEPEPPPPKLEPKPEPRPEPPKPEIAVREKPKKAEPKPEPKKVEAKKPEPTPDPMKDKLARESKRIEQQRAFDAAARELETIKDAKAKAAAATARNSALNAWLDRIRGKVRGNIVLPPNLSGNPEASFEINQLPSGEILSVRLRSSSGNPALDTAIERAILKSSPLPKPEVPEIFERSLTLVVRPLEN